MRRVPSLDGLRAISIVLVILSHLVKWKHVSLAITSAYGELGVRVFFVLSGYLITMLLLREQEKTSTICLSNFYVRRAFRIFPAAFVFLGIVVVLFWQQMHWYHVAAAVFYVSNMDISRPWIFGHLWSLSIEEQFYLLWPFALKQWRRHKTKILVSAFLITPLFHTALYAFRVHGGIVGSLPMYSDRLATGCLLAIFAPRLPRINRYAALLMLAAVVSIPLYPAINPVRSLFMLFVLQPILNLSIAGLVLHVIQSPCRALNWGPVAWLGRISYSLYLWQEAFCSNPSLHYGYTLALGALGCAAVSYYCVEQPMLRLREKLAQKPARKGSAPELETTSQPA